MITCACDLRGERVMEVGDVFESARHVFGSIDLLVHILQHLSKLRDRDAASRVNKDWLYASCSVPQHLIFRRVEDVRRPRWQNSLVASLGITLGNDELVSEGLQLASQQYAPSLQRLRLWSTLPTATGGQVALIAKCKNLVSLTLHEVAVSKPMSLATVAQNCKLLEEVTISYEAYPASPWHITAGNGLAFRDMFACPVWQVVDNAAVEELVKNCPRLRNLDLENCRAVGDVAAAALSKAPNLKTLRLVGTFDVSFSGLARLGECSALENVTLDLKRHRVSEGGIDRPYSSQPFDITATLSALVSCPGLTQLRLGSFVRTRGLPATWNSLELLEANLGLLTRNVMDLKPFAKGTPNLRTLQIQSDSQGLPSNSEGGEVLKRIGWACPPRLENLSIQCNKVDPSAIEALSNCTNLSTLRVTSTAVTSRGIAYLAARTQKLTELSLASRQSVRGVSDDGVQAIAQAAPSLRRLDLTRCTSLTDIGFASLATCSHLVALNLSYTAIGDVGLVTLVNALPALTEMFLEGCENVTNLTPLTWLRHLQVLGVQRCERAVTDNLIEEVVLHCKGLQELYLDGCSRLTDMAYISLAESRRLEVLSIRECPAVEVALMVLATSSVGWLTKVAISRNVPSCQGADLLRERGVLDVRL